MTIPIRRVAVIGAGVMGSGIAAHFANAGIPVLLLDIVPPEPDGRREERRRARATASPPAASRRRSRRKPAAFFHKRNARLVAIGNIEDDLGKLADCDLVIEAIIERLDIKQRAVRASSRRSLPPTRIVASNTSGLRIADMLAGPQRRASASASS